MLSPSSSCASFDLNGDGNVNVLDMNFVKVNLFCDVSSSGDCARSDLNGDGIVNILDMNTVKLNLFCVVSVGEVYDECFWYDVDLDGDVDSGDWRERFDEGRFGECFSGEGEYYSGIEGDLVFARRFLKDFLSGVAGSEVEEPLNPNMDQKLALKSFLESFPNYGEGFVVTDGKVFIPTSDGMFGFEEGRDVVESEDWIRYYLTINQDGTQVLLFEKDKTQWPCTPEYSSEPGVVEDSINCIFRDTVLSGADESPYIVFNPTARVRIRDYLDELYSRGMIKDYSLDIFEEEPETDLLYVMYPDEQVDTIYVSLGYEDIAGPEPDMDEIVGNYNSAVNRGQSIYFDGRVVESYRTESLLQGLRTMIDEGYDLEIDGARILDKLRNSEID